MIAIKGMEEMPKSCISCPLYVGKVGEGYCAIIHKWNATGGLNRLYDCPLVEIVTCKDCKYYRNGLEHCTQWVISTNDDFYCADGKR